MLGSLDFFCSAVRESDSYIDDHTHSGYELVYYTAGEGLTCLNKQAFAYRADHFAIIPPRCPHDERRDTQTHVHFFVFSYDNAPIQLQAGLYADDERRSLGQIVEQMAEELRGKRAFYEIKMRGLLLEAIVEMGRISGSQADVKVTHSNVIYARNYIRQYFREKIDLQSLADMLGYSYDRFRHVFKSETGFSPSQYVLRSRIDHAKQLLEEDRLSVTEISMECGFSTVPQFSMLFKKHVGASPTQYQRIHVEREG